MEYVVSGGALIIAVISIVISIKAKKNFENKIKEVKNNSEKLKGSEA